MQREVIKMTTKQNIEKVLWNACDSFRGKIDSSRYKDYILSMLFVKYLSDVYAETTAKYMEQYNGDLRRVERAMSRERFVMDETSTFTYLYNNRNDAFLRIPCQNTCYIRIWATNRQDKYR